MTYNDIILLVSKELNLPKELVNKVYKTYWKSIRDLIEQLSLKEDILYEEFIKLKTNFNIPSIGKLYVDWNKYLGVKERYNKLKGRRNENK